MKKLYGIVAAAMMLSSCSGAEQNEKVSRSVFAMDTYMTLTAYGDNAGEALDAAVVRIQELEAKWSVTDSGSEIYKADRSSGQPVAVSAETAELVAFGIDMNNKTGGALDISIYPVLKEWGFTTGSYKVPTDERIAELLENVGASRVTVSGSEITVPEGMMIDLGSVAKGAAADKVCEQLREAGVASALLDLGGNVQAVGSKPDGSKWKIGIRDPHGEGTVGTLSIENKAVVTSGGYERFFTENGKTYHHIMDPSTGRPAESGLLSVTVVGESGRYCDALSTSLFVMGAEKAEEFWRNENKGFDYIIITEDAGLLITKGISDDFIASSGRGDLKVTVVE